MNFRNYWFQNSRVSICPLFVSYQSPASSPCISHTKLSNLSRAFRWFISLICMFRAIPNYMSENCCLCVSTSSFPKIRNFILLEPRCPLQTGLCVALHRLIPTYFSKSCMRPVSCRVVRRPSNRLQVEVVARQYAKAFHSTWDTAKRTGGRLTLFPHINVTRDFFCRSVFS